MCNRCWKCWRSFSFDELMLKILYFLFKFHQNFIFYTLIYYLNWTFRDKFSSTLLILDNIWEKLCKCDEKVLHFSQLMKFLKKVYKLFFFFWKFGSFWNAFNYLRRPTIFWIEFPVKRNGIEKSKKKGSSNYHLYQKWKYLNENF